LVDIFNNSRIWTNNGWTPIEMREASKDDVIQNSNIEDIYE